MEITWIPGGDSPQTVAKGTGTFTAEGLVNGTSYTLTASAIYISGKSSPVSVEGKPSNITGPSEISGLEARISSADKTVQLIWNYPYAEEVDHFEITWTPGGASPMIVSKDSKPGLLITDLVIGTYYTFTVTSVDANGNKSAGVNICAKLEDITPPGTVRGLTAAPGDSQVVFKWTDPTDSDFDHVEISYLDGSGLMIVNKGEQNFTYTGLKNYTNYTFIVKSVDTSKLSRSLSVNVKPDPKMMLDVTDVTAVPGYRRINFKWKDPDDSGLSHIEITSLEGVGTQIPKSYQGLTLYNLKNGGSYNFTIKAVSVSGYKSPGVSISVKLEFIEANISTNTHTLFTGIDRCLYSTGLNMHCQLDYNCSGNRSVLKYVHDNVKAGAAGNGHSLVLLTDGRLVGGGKNDYGQLGLTSHWDELCDSVAAVAAGWDYSFYIKLDGTLYAIGRNDRGQLGDGSRTNQSVPVQLMGNMKMVAASEMHSLALQNDGSLFATGANTYGALGDGTTTDSSSFKYIMNRVKHVAAGRTFSIVLRTDGTVWVMGNNNYGQLGDGTTSNKLRPIQVMTGGKKVAAGESHALVLKTDGSLWGSGLNNYGQLGDNSPAERHSFTGLTENISDVAAAHNHTIILTYDGKLYGMGRNEYGQLAISSANTMIPLKMAYSSSLGANIFSLEDGHQTIIFAIAAVILAGGAIIIIAILRKRKLYKI